MATVHLPTILRDLVGEDRVSLSGPNVGALLSQLEAEHPGLSARIRDEKGALRPHVKIFVNGESVGLDDPVQEDSEVRILPSISGG